MDSAKNQLAEKLKTANNILVTVSRDPSVDQLSSLLGLTLLLNKMGKHAAAVFSGNVPSTLEFLQPDETIEKNTDSLRDFIIALDKSKADKLRYKVEDNVVRIFITPYKTSISQDDLEFSEGDFNVDVVVALGVHQQEDLDEAITSHGRILHDATVSSINTSVDGGLGSINWHDDTASSLCELVTNLAQSVGPELIDNQIATALLTGIVAETDRFSNDKTSSQTMSASAALMTAGANQQLVASKLEEPEVEVKPEENQDSADDNGESSNKDGTLDIKHDDSEENHTDSMPAEEVQPAADTDSQPEPQIEAPNPESEQPTPPAPEAPPEQPPQNDNFGSAPKLVTEPPTLGGTLTANSQPEGLDRVTDPLSMPASENPQLLDRAAPGSQGLSPATAGWTPPIDPQQPPPNTTLTDLEASVNSPHLSQQNQNDQANDMDAVRDEVNRAIVQNEDKNTVEPPLQALGSQPFDNNLQQPAAPQPDQQQPAQTDTPPQSVDPNAPPPVPPPIPFQFGSPPNNDQQ